MKRFAVYLPLALLLFYPLSAETTDLARSYFHFSVAKLHALQKEYPGAIAEFEKAIPLDPGSSALRVEFARTLWQAGEIRRAVEQCEKAKEFSPTSAEPYFTLGQIYFTYLGGGEQSMLDKASSEFSRVLELEPTHYEAVFYLARLHLLKENYKVAADLFSRLIQLQPAFTKAYYWKAIAHVELKEMEPAIEALEQSRRIGRSDSDSLKLLFTLYAETGQIEKALRTYGETMEFGSDTEIQQAVGKLLAGHKSFRKVIPVLRELAAKLPDNLAIGVKLGQALKEDNQYLEAAEVLNRLLKEDPGHIAANYELALTLAGLGERLQAIDRFLHLIKITESTDGKYSPEQQYNRDLFQKSLGIVYQETGQYEKAIELFRQMSQGEPNDYTVQLRLIYALIDADQLEEALSLSEKLVKEHGNQTFVTVGRARVLAAADRLEQGVRLLRGEIKKKPEEEQLYFALSRLYLDREKYRDAEKVVEDSLSQRPASELMEFQLGAIYERRKHFARAEAVFKSILKRNDQHAGVLNYLGYMLAERSVRLQEALRYIERAVEIDPYNGAYLDSLGWAYFKLNELELAEINLTRAAQLNEADATIYDHLGDLYYKLGQYGKARTYYEQSVFCAKSDDEHDRVREKLSNLKKLLSQKRRQLTVGKGDDSRPR